MTHFTSDINLTVHYGKPSYLYNTIHSFLGISYNDGIDPKFLLLEVIKLCT